VPIHSLSPKQDEVSCGRRLDKSMLSSLEKPCARIRSSVEQSCHPTVGRYDFINSRDDNIEIYSLTIRLSRLQKGAGDSQFAVGPGVISTYKLSVDGDIILPHKHFGSQRCPPLHHHSYTCVRFNAILSERIRYYSTPNSF
jgi:hypothetical protein